MTAPFEWKQPADDDGFESSRYGFGESQTQLYIDVDQADELEALQWTLGYPNGIDSASGNILRSLPQAHPQKPWLFALQDSVKCYAPRGKQTEAVTGFGEYAKYAKSRIVCDFKVPPFDILNDADRTYEWQRYTSWVPVTKTENIQLSRGTFQFLNAAADAQNQARGDTFNTGRLQRLQKTELLVTWFQVPWIGLCLDDWNTLNDNITQAYNTVNKYWWPCVAQNSVVSGMTRPAGVTGYAPGTLLFLDAVAKPETAPTSPDSMGIITAAGKPLRPPRVFTVELRFLYFDPTVVAGYPFRGHNLFPAKQRHVRGSNFGIRITAEFSPYWWMATADGTNDVNKMQFLSSDFNNIFKMVQRP